jgi:hypothetical protein
MAQGRWRGRRRPTQMGPLALQSPSRPVGSRFLWGRPRDACASPARLHREVTWRPGLNGDDAEDADRLSFRAEARSAGVEDGCHSEPAGEDSQSHRSRGLSFGTSAIPHRPLRGHPARNDSIRRFLDCARNDSAVGCGPRRSAARSDPRAHSRHPANRCSGSEEVVPAEGPESVRGPRPSSAAVCERADRRVSVFCACRSRGPAICVCRSTTQRQSSRPASGRPM